DGGVNVRHGRHERRAGGVSGMTDVARLHHDRLHGGLEHRFGRSVGVDARTVRHVLELAAATRGEESDQKVDAPRPAHASLSAPSGCGVFRPRWRNDSSWELRFECQHYVGVSTPGDSCKRGTKSWAYVG